MTTRLRLFVAVDLGAEVAASIARAIASTRLAAPRASWVRPGGAHLTLAFLGAVEGVRVPAIGAALARASARHRPLDLAVGGVGTFGRAASPKVLWFGVAGDVERLARLQRDVQTALVPLGFPAEQRRFHPHVTLARARDAGGDRGLAGAAERLATTRAVQAHVDRLWLMHSELGRGGSRYTPMAESPLGGASAG